MTIAINVLFFYSPEYAATFNNEDEIKGDNNNLCTIASGIYSNSCSPSIINFVNVGSFKSNKLQNNIPCFNLDSLDELLDDYTCGLFPAFALLKKHKQANVVVLCVKLCNNNSDKIIGLSSTIGFTIPAENCISIARTSNSYPNLTSNLRPTLLAHEIGHLLGCSHPLEPLEMPESQYLGGYGHHILDNDGKICHGTIMSSLTIPTMYFSNPNIFKYPAPHQNTPCGTANIAEGYKIVTTNLPRLANTI